MNRSLTLQHPARRDLAGNFAYIGKDSIEAAERFLIGFYDTAHALILMPEIGHLVVRQNELLKNLRFIPVKGFEKYLIFYRVDAQEIIIARVLHSARNIKRILGL